MYDSEFDPKLLKVLKKRDILGEANVAQYSMLWANIGMRVRKLEQKFQKERRRNPIIETTPPAAWIVAEVIPIIDEIRPNAGLEVRVLIGALRNYMRRVGPRPSIDVSEERNLVTTIEPYQSVVENLLVDLFDRRKSLRGILRIPPGGFTGSQTSTPLKPISLREDIVVRCIRQHLRNHEIAKALDDKKLAPRRYASYAEMVRKNRASFYSFKSQIKKRYKVQDESSERSHRS